MSKGDPDIEIKIGSKNDPAGFKDAESWIGRIKSAMKALIGEFAESEEAFGGVAQAVANQGRLTAAYAKQIDELASKMQDATAIADEKWLGVMEELTKHGANSGNIEQYTQAVANLAGLLKGDINTASRIFSRALEGNFEVLGRLGIRVRETGTDAEKLADLLKQVAEKGAGILENRAKSLSGQMDTLHLKVSDLMEAFGGLINRIGHLSLVLTGATKFLKFLTDLLPNSGRNLSEITNKFESASASVGGMAASVQDLSKAYKDADKSAEDFKRRQEEWGDAELGRDLAAVDFLEASKQITPADKSVLQSALRMGATERRAEREAKTDTEEERRLVAKRAEASNALFQAEDGAAKATREKERLLRMAEQAFPTVGASVMRDPKQMENLIRGSREDADKEFQRTGNYRDFEKRMLTLDSIAGLPTALTDASIAEESAGKARGRYQEAFGEISPRLETIQHNRAVRGFTREKAKLEYSSELLNVDKDGGDRSNVAQLLRAIQTQDQKNNGELIQILGQFLRQKEIDAKQLARMRNR